MAEMWFPAPPETAHDGYNVMVCRCDGGAYIGARKAGTPCCCEVCGFMTQEQLDHLAQAARVEDVARLAEVERLVGEWKRLRDEDVLVYASRYIADLSAALGVTAPTASEAGA